jgi:DMSO reductase family type II enzyme chaperone
MFSYSLDGLEIDGDVAEDVEIEDNEITARAGVYHTFSRLFVVPDQETYDTAVKGEWPGKLREAAELLPYDFDFGVSALADSVALVDYDAEYQRLFGGNGEDPAASIFAGNYADGERSDRVDEIIRQFEYFGLKASGQSRSPDHLATELEFMQYLAFKEAASASPRLSASFHRAQEDFVERHLVPWLPAFAGKVEQANALPIYTWASQTLSGFVAADLEYITA